MMVFLTGIFVENDWDLWEDRRIEGTQVIVLRVSFLQVFKRCDAAVASYNQITILKLAVGLVYSADR